MELVLTGLVCLAIVVGCTLAGMSVLRRGGLPGATGTLGSVLGMIDPATGAPTREETAAAREELKQRRHEAAQSGRGPDHDEPYSGKITLRSIRPPAPAPGRPGHAPGTPAQAPGTPAVAPGTPGHAPGRPGQAPGEAST